MKPSPSESANKARILVVDDHPLLREGLAQLINRQPDLYCCGEASDTASAHEAVLKTKPALVVMDLQLRREDGLELLKSLKARHPTLPVLVLSNHDEGLYAERVLRAGAGGYLMKEEATDEVLSAIRTILQGELYVSRKMVALVLRKMVQGARPAPSAGIENLSDRELQVLQLLGSGLSTRQIAEALHLSFKTIESHRETIKHKLGLRDAAALLHYAAHWAQMQGPLGAPHAQAQSTRGQIP